MDGLGWKKTTPKGIQHKWGERITVYEISQFPREFFFKKVLVIFTSKKRLGKVIYSRRHLSVEVLRPPICQSVQPWKFYDVGQGAWPSKLVL